MQMFFVKDLKQLLNNLPMNMSIIICLAKFATFLNKRRELIRIHLLFAKLDRKQLTSEEIESLNNRLGLCKKITFITFVMYESVASTAAINAAFSHRKSLLFEIWTPYDYHNPPLVYWATFTAQFIIFVSLSIQNLTNDVSGPLYFIMLNKHLEIVLDRIRRVGWDKKKTQDENYQDFINCIEDHRIIMSIFDVLQNTVSYTVFIQFVTSAVVLAMQALLYVLYPPDLSQLGIIFFYFLDVTMEILACCYFSNNFMVITDKTVTAIFSSNFIDQSQKFRKTAIVFMQMTQKSHVLVAGKIFPVTLTTFMLASLQRFR
ncbi:unnamed protein product [Hermetia illucens]|uniref:Odorant receptor n=1 Tax=Hermetia illucens TaxID=343691 RepID=A0A7R8V021_HERIL|nr:unnamed protein product [Hermetia illucens]